MNAYEGGVALELARRAAGLTMMDTVRKTEEIWGKEGRITQPLISRYEKAQVGERVNIEVLAKLCWVYGIQVDPILEAYGLPVRTNNQMLDDRIRMIALQAAAMPEASREYFYEQLEQAANMALLKTWQMFGQTEQNEQRTGTDGPAYRTRKRHLTPR